VIGDPREKKKDLSAQHFYPMFVLFHPPACKEGMWGLENGI
jgi:hypothetical protein